MGKKGKAAAVEAPTTMPNPPLWNGLSNALPAVDEENPLPSPGASTGNWKEDYVAYCAVLGIKPHPRLVATRVYVPEGDAGDEGKGGAGDADDGKDGAGEEKEQVKTHTLYAAGVRAALLGRGLAWVTQSRARAWR